MKKPRKARTVELPALEPRDPSWPLLYTLLLLSIFPMLWWPQDQWVYEDDLLMSNPVVTTAKIATALTTRYWYGLGESAAGDAVFRPFVLMSAMPFVKIPQGIRVINWLTYLLSGLLLFLWLRPRMKLDSLWPYLAAALLLLHPVASEIRSQVSGLAETMPLVLAATAFLIAEKNPYLGLALVALAPGFKETGFFGLMGYSILQFSRGRTTATIAGTALLIGWAIFHYAAVGGWSGENPPPMLNPLVAMGLGDGLVSRLYLLGHALRLMLVPTGLSVDYSDGTLTLPAKFFQLNTLIGTAFLILLLTKVRNLLKAGALGALLLSTIAGTLFWNLHMAGILGSYYIPLFHERAWAPLYFGILLWAGTLVASVEEKGAAIRRGIAVAVAIVAAFFFWQGLERQRNWVNSATLFLHDSFAHPQNARLHFEYGFAAGKINNWPEARDAFTRAVQLRPNFSQAHFRLSLVYDQLNEPAKAKEHQEKATRLGVKFPTPASNP